MAETGTLRGRRIVVTRPQKAEDDLQRRLHQKGAVILALPCIRINALPIENEVLQNITRKNELIFTSQIAVREFFNRLQAAKIDLPQGIRCHAINAKTRQILARYFSGECDTASANTGEDFARYLARILPPNTEIIHPVSRAADATMKTQLVAAGLVYHRLDIYEPAAVVDTNNLVQLQQANPDLILFYSPSAVQAFNQAIPAGMERYFKSLCCAAIGPTTAAALKTCGFTQIIMAEKPQAQAMSTLISNHFINQPAASHILDKIDID